jgi:uncharacterized protein involved in outer membrane biogenesis
MKQRSYKRRNYLIALAVLLMLILAATILLPYVVDINNYRDFIVEKAEELLDRRVSIAKIQLHLINGIGIRCVGVVISDKAGEAEFISSRDMLLKFEPIPLLDKELVINKIILDHPRLNIERDSAGKFNFPAPKISPKPKAEEEEEAGVEWSLSRLLIDRIIIRQGQARLVDRRVDSNGLVTTIRELNLTLEEFELGQPFSLSLDAELDRGGDKTSHIALSAQVAGLGGDITDSAININAQARISDWDLAAFSPYYKDYVPFGELAGLADIELDYKGNLTDNFQWNAKVNLKSTQLTYANLFTAPLPFQSGQAQVEVTLRGNRLDTKIKRFTLDNGRFNIAGQLQLADLLSPRRRISLQTTFSPFAFDEGKRYIPFRVMPPKVADFINNSISSGTVKYLSVNLDGELCKFKEINKPENSSLLSASAAFDNLDLALANRDYKFERISGSVDLRAGKLIFNELTGSIENSRFKIYNSRISNLYSAPQFELYATSKLVWSDNYLQEKLPITIKEQLNPRGEANLRLTAKGDSREMALAGALDLSPGSYSYGSWLKKEPGQRNILDFEARLLDWKDIELQKLIYSLGASRALINVKGTKPLRFDSHTARFDIRELKALMPDILPPDTEGFIMADARFLQSAAEPPEMHITGNMAIRESRFHIAKYSTKLEGNSRLQFNISARPEGLLIGTEADLTQAGYAYKDWLSKPRGLKNTVTFQGILKDTGELQLEKLLISLDSSQLIATGRLKDLTSMEAKIKLIGEGLDLNHLTPVLGKLLPGKVSIASGYLNLAMGITGPLNDYSRLNIEGKAQIYKAHLSGEDPAYRLDNLDAQLTPLGDGAMELALQVEHGSYQQIKFSHLVSRGKLRESKLLINDLSLNAYQGNLYLTGRTNLRPATPTVWYDLSFRAENMNLAKLANDLKLKNSIISGRISADGQLSNSGMKRDKFAGLNGLLKLELTNGKIKKYGTLAKIFSLISPGVLLNGGLPDFKSKGFPYQSIQGNFNIVNGVAKTEDLTLMSDAWTVVTLGQIDLVKKQVDLEVYVQPLKTLDNLISKIPIAGKILKGKKRGVIDTYFTVKGNLDAPEVTAKPLTSLAENIWGIFKRTLSLPLDLLSK